MVHLKHAAVFGSGAFGTSLAVVLAKRTENVSVWHMKQEEADLINEKKENVLFLKGAPLPLAVHFTADVKETVHGAEIILFVVPTQFLRGFLKTNVGIIRDHLREHPETPLLVCSKGIEQSTLLFPGQIVAEFFPGSKISVLAGPSFAIEVATGKVTSVSVASEDIEEARRVMKMMSSPDQMFRCWATTDVVGCEVASAVKNVLAIASGISKGMGQGLNARAALISRGLLEVRDLTHALGGSGEAVFGLAGLGDLLLTCSSELSRNFSVGEKLGSGMSLKEIQKTQKAVAEGVATADSLFRLAKKKKVSLLMCERVYAILYKGEDPFSSFHKVLTGRLVDEGIQPLYPRNKSKL